MRNESPPDRLKICAKTERYRSKTGRSIKNRAPRGAFLAALLVVSGCSTTKSAYLPPDEADPMSGWGEEIYLVKPGMFVTITLKSGEKVRGEVVEVTSEEVVLGQPSNFGFRHDQYSAVDIERIEFGKPTGSANFFAGVAVGMVAMFGIIAMAFAMTGPYYGS